MKSSLRHIDDNGLKYDALLFVCPGCEEPYTLSTGEVYTPSGFHMLPVNNSEKKPSWEWNNNLDEPALSPSILAHGANQSVCHSFLRDGVFEFLGDCTHRFAGQRVAMPDMPEWFNNEGEEE